MFEFLRIVRDCAWAWTDWAWVAAKASFHGATAFRSQGARNIKYLPKQILFSEDRAQLTSSASQQGWDVAFPTHESEQISHFLVPAPLQSLTQRGTSRLAIQANGMSHPQVLTLPLYQTSATHVVLPIERVDLSSSAAAGEIAMSDIAGSLSAQIPTRAWGSHGLESRLLTTCLMVIDKPNGQRMTRVAKLDTGAARNVISRHLAVSTGAFMRKYQGQPLRAAGNRPMICPKEEVTLEWHVSEKPWQYQSDFVVLEDDDCRDRFDILLCEDEIAERHFYERNSHFLFLNEATEDVE